MFKSIKQSITGDLVFWHNAAHELDFLEEQDENNLFFPQQGVPGSMATLTTIAA